MRTEDSDATRCDPADAALDAAIEAAFDRIVDLPESAWAGALDALAGELPQAALQRVRALLTRLAARPDVLAPPQALAPALALERELPAGSRVGRWTVQGRLGSGGQGLVLAVQRSEADYAQQAVLKLPRSASYDRDAARRLLRERQLLAQLQHPGLPKVLDGVLLPDGSPGVVIERIHGLPIDAHAEQHGLGLRGRVQLLLQVVGIVAHAHARLVLHRDIKPANVLVEEGGRVVLLDFGVAQSLEASATRTAAGYTLAYAAPEQVRGERGSVATDIYGIGALALKLCSGRAPFEGMDARAQVQAVLAGDPPLPAALDSDLAAILATCLRPRPEQRYASADRLAEDLQAWLQGLPVRARAGGRAYVIGKFLRRHALAVGAAAVVALVLALSTALALQQAQRSERARLQAEAALAAAERSQARALSINEILTDVLLDLSQEDRRGVRLSVAELMQRIEAQARRPTLLPDARVDVLNQLAMSHGSAGRPQQALALLDEALALVAELPPEQRERRFEAALWRSRGTELRWLQRPQEALAAIDQALRLLADEDEASVINDLAYLQDQRANLLADAGAVTEVIASRRQTLALVERHGMAAGTLMFYAVSNLALDLGRAGQEDEAVALLRERIAGMPAQAARAHPQGPAILFVQLGRMLRLRGEAEAALEWYGRGLDLRERHHDARHFTFLLGRAERLIFELEAGLEAATVQAALAQLLTQFQQAGHQQALALASIQAWLGRAAALAGDPQTAADAIDAAQAALLGMPEHQRNWPMAWLQVVLAAQALGERGQPRQQAALQQLLQVLERYHAAGHPLRLGAEAALARLQGDSAAAQARCRQLAAALPARHVYRTLAQCAGAGSTSLSDAPGEPAASAAGSNSNSASAR